MVIESKIDNRAVYICEECGFGYIDRETAHKCQGWCSTHKSCNLKITRNAVYKPVNQALR